MELTGAQTLLECLKKENVELIFGYPGGMVIDIYDEISRHPEVRHILVRHEQAAVHAADGYARASGKTGVCLVTSGPGATNAVTGLATAYSDSIPLVIFTGQVPTHLIGNDAFQEVDIIGITRPCTKHSYLVKDIKDLPGIIRRAFFLARSGRPGPVLVDLPKNVTISRGEFVWPEKVNLRSYNPTYKPNLQQLRRAAELLLEAERPLILTGGGTISSGAGEALTEIARKYHIPVVSTLMGLGGFPGTDLVGKQGGRFGEDPGHSGALMRVWGERGRQAGQCQPLAFLFVGPQYMAIEQVVVRSGEPRCPGWILPQPFLEPCGDLFGFVSRRKRGIRVDTLPGDSAAISVEFLHRTVDKHWLVLQHQLQQLWEGYVRGAPHPDGFGTISGVGGHLDVPLPARQPGGLCLFRAVQSHGFTHKVCHIGIGNPRGAQTGFDLPGR